MTDSPTHIAGLAAVAARLQTCSRTVSRMLRRGKLDGYRLRNYRWHITLASIQAWEQGQRTQGADR